MFDQGLGYIRSFIFKIFINLGFAILAAADIFGRETEGRVLMGTLVAQGAHKEVTSQARRDRFQPLYNTPSNRQVSVSTTDADHKREHRRH